MDDLEKVQIGSEGSLGLGPQPTLGGHGPLAIRGALIQG